ncbi:UPF0057-domain-containing protein [Saccharata proteae CBS 121410]|uniref:UPF0057-domain-containing protein n=1 Tax=Saccharata proteae CBS 121410 TaxID=1314787 RepID=A0A9P4LVR6_9PEZI|nr:UPF0057-domain-containing protein [Saccharata proteae CBS 121410]
MCGTDIFLAVLAVLFPPVAVWVKRGICSADSLINIALCCLGFLPGLLHAWYIIYTYPDPIDSYERVPDREQAGGGHVTYYYVQHSPSLHASGPRQHPQHPQQQYQSHPAKPNYGSVNSSAPQKQFPQQSSGAANQTGSGEGSADAAAPPPTYADAVGGDHKVQSQE